VEDGVRTGDEMPPSDDATTTADPLPAALAGWLLAGSDPGHYEVGAGDLEDPPRRAGYLRAKPQPQGFGTLMQMFKADSYRGTRQMLTARIRAEDVEEWAGLWMRVDGVAGSILAFDNMQSRPITGTTDWTGYRVVLDVSPGAVHVAFGVLLEGSGAVWLDAVQLREVGEDVPTTGIGSETDAAYEYPAGPTNLDFSNEG
jgi:hypothetical protein